MENLQTKPLPKIGKIKVEDFHLTEFDLTPHQENIVYGLEPEFLATIEDLENLIVLKNGTIVYKNLSDAFAHVEITSYEEAQKDGNENALSIFNAYLTKDHANQLQLANALFQNSAILIRIPKNTVIYEPLKVNIYGKDKDLVHHTYVIAEENSECSIVENILSLQGKKVSMISETYVSSNAQVSYVGIDRLPKETNAYIERAGFVSQDGRLIYALGQLNDGNTISTNHIQLLGKNAYAESRNVLLTAHDVTHAVTVKMDHLAPHTVGHITNHGIVKDQGFLYIEGIGKIKQGMTASDSQQSTKVVSLSDEAKVVVNPLLLIDEYDVQAGHGAGIGKFDEEELYYLMSRGLTKRDAEKLMIIGFLYPIIELIPLDGLKKQFVEMIEQKLNQ